MLIRFSEAYHSKSLTVPLEWLSKVLIYSSERQLITDLKHYKCDVSVNRNVRFDKSSFDRTVDVVSSKPILFFSSLRVECCIYDLLFFWYNATYNNRRTNLDAIVEQKRFILLHVLPAKIILKL